MADPAQRQQMLAEGSEAADFIRTSIVQAALNEERGAYGALRWGDWLGWAGLGDVLLAAIA